RSTTSSRSCRLRPLSGSAAARGSAGVSRGWVMVPFGRGADRYILVPQPDIRAAGPVVAAGWAPVRDRGSLSVAWGAMAPPSASPDPVAGPATPNPGTEHYFSEDPSVPEVRRSVAVTLRGR